ncbi:TPA: TFIIB-type zinc ribbon-containing protein, partial [Streptococcus suis]|nr:TFIIB-type zinc ribbon-containing protein [Streptococcus suis]
MSSDKIFEIPIPSDNDGFIVLKCPICSEKFMIQVQDVNDDSLIDVWCPKCGL